MLSQFWAVTEPNKRCHRHFCTGALHGHVHYFSWVGGQGQRWPQGSWWGPRTTRVSFHHPEACSLVPRTFNFVASAPIVSLVTHQVDHLACVCLPSFICFSEFSNSISPIFILACLLLLSSATSFYVLDKIRYNIFNYFLSVCGLRFRSLHSVFQRADVLIFMICPLHRFFFCESEKSLPNLSLREFLWCFLAAFYSFGFYI